MSSGFCAYAVVGSNSFDAVTAFGFFGMVEFDATLLAFLLGFPSPSINSYSRNFFAKLYLGSQKMFVTVWKVSVQVYLFLICP